MHRTRSRLRNGGGGFNPITLWPGGTEAGLWYDSADTTTVFQTSAGNTAGAVGSPVGYRLDKRLGIALGSELVTVAADRQLSSDTGFWTKSVGVSIGSGVATFANVSDTNGLFRALGTTGKYYEITFDIVSLTSGNGFKALAGGNYSVVKNTVGTHTVRVACASITTNVGVVADAGTVNGSIDNLSIKEVTGNHALQATSAARPEFSLISGVYSDFFDGSDDEYGTAAGITLAADMDCFIAVSRTGNFMFIHGDTAAKYLGAANTGGSVAHSGAGSSVTYFVNGVAVPGGTSTTEAQLNTAIPSGSWAVVEARNVDLSTWTRVRHSGFASHFTNGDIGGIILCPAQTADKRTQIRRWLGSRVGLSL